MSKKFNLIIIAIGSVILVLCLNQIFSGNWILSQSFSLGPVSIHYYGMIMALAVACAFFVAIKRAGNYGLEPKRAEDLLFWIVVVGFIGARVYHILSHFNYYLAKPSEIIQVWNGGLSIYGAVIGGIVALFLVKKILNLKSSILNLLDWLTPSLILGQIIGRFGNMFNYEAFGYPTNLPWKMFVPSGFRPEGYMHNNFFHPFFLYEALGSTLILFVVLKTLKTKVSGRLFFCYLLLYNVLRFGLEFIRLDSTLIGGFRLNALVALLLVVVAVVCLKYKNNYGKVS